MTLDAPKALPTLSADTGNTAAFPPAPLVFTRPMRSALEDWGLTQDGWAIAMATDDDGDEWAVVEDTLGDLGGVVIATAGREGVSLNTIANGSRDTFTNPQDLMEALRTFVAGIDREAELGRLVVAWRALAPMIHEGPDARLMMLCGRLGVHQAVWARLLDACPDMPDGGVEEQAFEAFSEETWPGTAGAQGDLVGLLLTAPATSPNGRRARARAVLEVTEAGGWVGGRDDDMELVSVVIREAAGVPMAV